MRHVIYLASMLVMIEKPALVAGCMFSLKDALQTPMSSKNLILKAAAFELQCIHPINMIMTGMASFQMT